MRKIVGITEIKVGAMVLFVLGIVAYISIKVSENPAMVGRTKSFWFLIDDASGLIKSGSVTMSGIQVGIIKSIVLHKGKARLDVIVQSDSPIGESSRVEIRPNGILGDKFVEISRGVAGERLLEDGEEIKNVLNQNSFEALFREVGNITEAISQLTDNLKLATQEGGEESGPLGRIIHNLDKMTQDLSDVSGGRKQRLEDVIDNLHAVSETLNNVVNDKSSEGFQTAWKNAVAGLSRIERSLSNLETITNKVNSGHGTLGRLINDEETVEQINTAVTGVNEFIGAANKIETSIDSHSEYLMEQSMAKSFLGVKVQPGLDRYYEVQLVDDPKGVIETNDTTTINNPDTPGETSTTVRETRTFQNKVKLSLLYAKNFYDFTVKGGMIENSGGLGFDYFFFRRKLRLSVEAFDVSGGSFHLRSFAKYSFLKGIYLIGGGDDLASQTGNQSSFLGVGINLTNDDIKNMASKVSF